MASAALGNAADKVKDLAGAKTGKMAQLAAVTQDVHNDKWRLTSDFGVKQNNTDAWLSVATDDQKGPQLLEDQFAREKVCLEAFPRLRQQANSFRSTDSTMSVSLSALSTPVALVPLESSPSSSRPPTSHLPAS